MNLDPANQQYVRAVADALRNVLGNALVGVYLHGSGALGGFVSARSDIDLLALAEGPVRNAQRTRIAEALLTPDLECPAGGGLEFHLVRADVAREPGNPPPFELHLSMRSDGVPKVFDGRPEGGDPDLLAHIALCREAGVNLVGPPPGDVFGPVPRHWLLRSLADDLAWSEHHARPEYGVLNACRAWRLLEEGVICSKVDGGRWALDRLSGEEARLVRAAIARQGGTAVPLAAARAVAFTRRIRRRLLQGPESSEA